MIQQKALQRALTCNNQIKLMLLKMGFLKSGKKIQEKIVKYCNSMKGDKPGHYKYSAGCPQTLWASAFAVLILSFIGKLEEMSENEKSSWLKYIQSFQDEKTGFFLDPKFKDKDKRSLIHSNELLFAHSSTFVMGALVLLGGKPLYPIKWRICHPCYRQRSRAGNGRLQNTLGNRDIIWLSENTWFQL